MKNINTRNVQLLPVINGKLMKVLLMLIQEICREKVCGSGNIAPCFLDLEVEWVLVLSIKSKTLHAGVRTPGAE
jgi:hypothetical protein